MTHNRNISIPKENILQAFEAVKDIAIEEAQLQLITETDFQRVLAFQKEHLFPDEPLSIATATEWSADLERTVVEVLKGNMSLMAVMPVTGEIIGVRMIQVSRPDDRMETETIADPGLKLMSEILNDMGKLSGFFTKYNVTKTIHLFGLSVNKAYRNRGIGRQLMEAAVKFASALGPLINVTCIKGEASSNFAKKIYENLEFDFIREIRYKDYMLHGKLVLQNISEHTSHCAYGKTIHS